ncbi:hypothetical protein BH10CYA1_BH10CYA1_31870 [soil metagenome]
MSYIVNLLNLLMQRLFPAKLVPVPIKVPTERPKR